LYEISTQVATGMSWRRDAGITMVDDMSVRAICSAPYSCLLTWPGSVLHVPFPSYYGLILGLFCFVTKKF
jgi:hypothetical protein